MQKSIDCESIIRHGIQKYTDEVGNLYVYLADYFIRQGLFEKARDVFEEALDHVIYLVKELKLIFCFVKILTARDFGIIFNAYVKFEEEMLNILSEKDVKSVKKAIIIFKLRRKLNKEMKSLMKK